MIIFGIQGKGRKISFDFVTTSSMIIPILNTVLHCTSPAESAAFWRRGNFGKKENQLITFENFCHKKTTHNFPISMDLIDGVTQETPRTIKDQITAFQLKEMKNKVLRGISAGYCRKVLGRVLNSSMGNRVIVWAIKANYSILQKNDW